MSTAVPYRAGPVGRFIAWLDRLPWHGWWLLVALFALPVAWAHAVMWATGRLPAGALDSSILVLAVYGPYALGAGAIGVRVANRALMAFWPATGWPDSERPEWVVRLSAAPARYEWPSLVVGAIGGLLALAASPDTVLGPPGNRLAVYVAYAPAFLFGYGMLGAGLVLTIHWLRLVARIHREATAIDPFDRVPVYAFSRLTVAVGLSYVLATYYSFSINGAFQVGNLVSLAFLGTATTFGVIAFVAPLWGIHGRLVREKERLLADVERRVTRLAEEMYDRIDAGDFAATASLNTTLSGLTTLRDRVSHLPTWPWPPQLLRGFLSALLLPIIIFVASRLVESYLP